tara:strand:- start:5324 stop:5473 length:150 start_codon:yes stop_codon:yes gene_type:complete
MTVFSLNKKEWSLLIKMKIELIIKNKTVVNEIAGPIIIDTGIIEKNIKK